MKRRALNTQDKSREVQFGEVISRKKPRAVDTEKVEKFNKKSLKCKEFFWKKSTEVNMYGQVVGPSVASCKLTGKSCKFKNCPLIK